MGSSEASTVEFTMEEHQKNVLHKEMIELLQERDDEIEKQFQETQMTTNTETNHERMQNIRECRIILENINNLMQNHVNL